MPTNRLAYTKTPASQPASEGMLPASNPSNYGNATSKVINLNNNNWLSDSVVFTVDSAWRYVVHVRNTNNGASSIHIDDVRVYGMNTATYLSCDTASGGYRFGFNGQEKDNEVYGTDGSSYTAEFWQYDSRLGRRWNVDPLAEQFPSWSPYRSFFNNPLLYVDPDGKAEIITLVIRNKTNGKVMILSKVTSGEVFSKLGENWTGNCDPCKTYDWYDRQTVFHVSIDNNGLSFDAVDYHYVNKKKTSTLSNNEWEYKLSDLINHSQGGLQKGGWHLVTEGGGEDPTNFRSLSLVETMNIDLLFTSLINGNVLGKGKLPELPDINTSTGPAEFVDKIKNLFEENYNGSGKESTGDFVPIVRVIQGFEPKIEMWPKSTGRKAGDTVKTWAGGTIEIISPSNNEK